MATASFWAQVKPSLAVPVLYQVVMKGSPLGPFSLVHLRFEVPVAGLLMSDV
jgi:hypothetical protein